MYNKLRRGIHRQLLDIWHTRKVKSPNSYDNEPGPDHKNNNMKGARTGEKRLIIMMNIAITNLGKYNEGELIYKWVELPATEEELQAAFDEIGINERYEEFFITDYECDYMRIGEYDNISELNEIAETVESLQDYEKDIVKALINNGYDLTQALDAVDDCIIYDDCDDMSDVAYRMYEEGALFGDRIPEYLENYIDWDAIGRDLSFDGEWIETDNGYIEVLR